LARINSMQGIDLALFDFDRHNTIYYFGLNSEEQIYFRYGGRDSKAANTYLNLDSLNLALEQGLEIHRKVQKNPVAIVKKPIPKFPHQITNLNKYVVQPKRCVECHHIAHFQTTEAESNGTLDKMSDMFRSPDIQTLGINLNIPKGLEVKKSSGAAQVGGLREGDLIQKINGQSILTFGDFQYYLDKVDRGSKAINLTVSRNDLEKTISIVLPKLWWVTDLSYRNWTVNPRTFFESQVLANEEKKALNLPIDGLASRVTEVAIDAMLEAAHELKKGDIITAVNGRVKNPLGADVQLHIKLFHKSGETVDLDIIREGKKLKLPLHTKRKFFRRVED